MVFKSLVISTMLGLMIEAVQAETLLFTSNTPELYPHKNGYSLAKTAAYVERLKDQNDAVLFISGGDSISPNPLSVYDHGAHMIAIFGAMQLDIMTLNRREFKYGIDQVTLLSGQAEFPMVLSNLFDKRTHRPISGVLPYIMTRLGRFNIGVISTVSEDINTSYLFNKGLVNDTAQFVNSMAQTLRDEGADYTILVTEADYLEQAPVERLSQIDVVIITQEGPDRVVSQDPLVVYSGGVDDELMQLTFRSGHVKADVVHTGNELPSSAVESIISRYTSQLSIVLDQRITTLAKSMQSYRETLRREESNWANLVLDAVREYGQADFAALGSGSFRGDRSYPAGYVLTRRDIQQELPFGGYVHVVDVTPEQLSAILEHGVSKVETLDGRFLQVSGFKYQYDPNRPQGERIVAVTDLNDQPLNDQHYTLAISDYMLKGGDGYQFHQANDRLQSASHQRLIWNVVSDYLADFDSITPKREGRIIRLSSGDTKAMK